MKIGVIACKIMEEEIKSLIKEALVEAEQLIENNPNSFFLHNIHFYCL